MSPIVPMSRIVDDAAQIILEPPLRIDQIIADEQAALDARRAARAAEQETNQ